MCEAAPDADYVQVRLFVWLKSLGNDNQQVWEIIH